MPDRVAAPYALLAELTHRCPLRCGYCSNPLELQPVDEELSTEEWLRVITEASTLGALQIHFSGGEPLLREDLEELAGCASNNGLYTNLITSGVGLTEERAGALVRSGLDSVQISLQAADRLLSDSLAGRASYLEKQQAARAVVHSGLPLTMNVVLHRLNLDQLEKIIDTCVGWGAERLELANVQLYNWALVNREMLLPNGDQLARAEEIYQRKKAELGERIELIWVVADYYEQFPKPCMGGWGKVQLTVTANGLALPCPVASMITGLQFDSVRERSLRWIWEESPAFNEFRGFDWMADPCRTCDRRFVDFGGCRCQAFALTGHAERADPVCHLSPDHEIVLQALASAEWPSAAQSSSDQWKKLRYRDLH